MRAIDSIDIDATAERVFHTVLDYPNIASFYPDMRCKVLTPGPIGEGSRVAHTFFAPYLRIATRFVRTIVELDAPTCIRETYDGGALVGTGEWTFADLGDGRTRASYACSVRGNDPVTLIGLAFTGPKLHKLGYERLLRALKRNCEGETVSYR